MIAFILNYFLANKRIFFGGKPLVIRAKSNGMRGYRGHNQLDVFVLNRAPRSRMKEGTRRVNWNSATRRMMLLRLAGTRKKKETGDGKRIEGNSRGRRVASKEYLLPSSPPLTHRFTAWSCKHLLTIWR